MSKKIEPGAQVPGIRKTEAQIGKNLVLDPSNSIDADVALSTLRDMIFITAQKISAADIDVGKKISLSAELNIMKAEADGFYRFDTKTRGMLMQKIQSVYSPEVRRHWKNVIPPNPKL